MNKKKVAFIISLSIICVLLILIACSKTHNPISPTPYVPGGLSISFTFLNNNPAFGIGPGYPLVFQVFTKISDMTNHNYPAPVFQYATIQTSGSTNIANVPIGTYYLLIFLSGSGDTIGSLYINDDPCWDSYLFYPYNTWQGPGQPIQTTPITIYEGRTISINLKLDMLGNMRNSRWPIIGGTAPYYPLFWFGNNNYTNHCLYF